MNIHGQGKTDTGAQRTKNDDSFLIDANLGLYVVCDGVSGHAAGDTASRMCAETVRKHVTDNAQALVRYRSDRSLANRAQLATVLRDAIHLASRKILAAAESDPAKRGMATTVDILLMAHDHAILGHVGDSRVYLLRGDQVHQLTEDHKVSHEMKKQGLWTPEDEKASPYSNVLTRAVGMGEFVQVDTLQVELMPGDLFLLCSDGLSDYFQTLAPEFKGIVAKHSAEKKNPDKFAESICQELIRFANSCGGKDNITSVVVSVDGAPQGNLALDAMRKSEVLGKVPLLRYLNYAELMKILSLVQLREYAPGAAIIEEGSVGTEMYVLLTGKVEIRKSNHTISRHDKGAVFGEMGLFDNAARSASVVTQTDAVAMAISRKDLLPLLRQEPQIAVKFFWALNQELNRRLRATSQDLANAKATLESGIHELPFAVDEVTLPG